MKVNPSIPETIPKFVDALPIPEVARPYGYNDYFCDDYSEDGSLHYPDNATPPVAAPIPSTPSFFFGETIVVNGKLWPYLEVEPRKYRFRLLNGSNNRGYDLSLDNGAKFIQIGTDLGLLRHSVELESFVMEPAERMDIIIDF